MRAHGAFVFVWTSESRGYWGPNSRFRSEHLFWSKSAQLFCAKSRCGALAGHTHGAFMFVWTSESRGYWGPNSRFRSEHLFWCAGVKKPARLGA